VWNVVNFELQYMFPVYMVFNAMVREILKLYVLILYNRSVFILPCCYLSWFVASLSLSYVLYMFCNSHYCCFVPCE